MKLRPVTAFRVLLTTLYRKGPCSAGLAVREMKFRMLKNQAFKEVIYT